MHSDVWQYRKKRSVAICFIATLTVAYTVIYKIAQCISVIQHGCNIILTNQDLFILALIKANFLLPQMQRKYSAPGQLCSMGGHMPASVNPTAGRKGSLCVPNQQFGYTCPTYSMPQWAQTSPLSSTAPPAGLQQGFLIPSGAHQSGNSCGSTNLRTTQASWNNWVGARKGKAVPRGVEIIGPSPLHGRVLSDSLHLERLSGPYNVTRVIRIC